MVWIRDAAGQSIGSASLGPASPRDFIDAVTLPSTGTYTVYIDPATDRTGTVAVRLSDAADATAPPPVGGPAASVTIDKPGQNATITFAGSAGDRISVSADGLGWSRSWVDIKGPSGQVEMPGTYANQGPLFFEPRRSRPPAPTPSRSTRPRPGRAPCR
jgi:hypothetical protein